MFTIYSTPICPYCNNAKHLLKSKGYEYIEISVAEPEARAKIVEMSGMRTVPVIYLKGRLIGGFTELAALDQSGELPRLVAAASN